LARLSAELKKPLPMNRRCVAARCGFVAGPGSAALLTIDENRRHWRLLAFI